VRLEEIAEIGRGEIMEGFENEDKKFKMLFLKQEPL